MSRRRDGVDRSPLWRWLLFGAAAGYAAERRWIRPRVIPRPDRVADAASFAVEPDVAFPDDDTVAVVDTTAWLAEGTRVAVRVVGPAQPSLDTAGGDEPVLVAVHGWRCDRRAWNAQINALAPRCTVITPELPGHGRSSSPAEGHYDLDLLGDAVAASVDRSVAGIDEHRTLVLAGHSLGGMAVLNALRRHPALADRTRGVVLVATASRMVSGLLRHDPPARPLLGVPPATAANAALARLEELADRYAGSLVAPLHHPLAKAFAERLVGEPTDASRLLIRHVGLSGQATEELVAFTEDMLLDGDPEVLVALLPALLRLDEDGGLDVLVRRRIPTCVVVGAVDRMTPPRLSRRMAELTGARLEIVEGCGHFLPAQAPERLTGILAEYLSLATDREEGGADGTGH